MPEMPETGGASASADGRHAGGPFAGCASSYRIRLTDTQARVLAEARATLDAVLALRPDVAVLDHPALKPIVAAADEERQARIRGPLLAATTMLSDAARRGAFGNRARGAWSPSAPLPVGRDADGCAEISVERLSQDQNALDLHMRLPMGQLSEIAWYLRMSCVGPFEDVQRVQSALDGSVRAALFPGLLHNAYHGIHSKNLHGDCRVAWDVMQAVRHRISWDLAGNPPKRDWSTMMGVNYDEPMASSPEGIPAIAPATSATVEAAPSPKL